MRILGVDPGLDITGYGVIDATGPMDRMSLVEAGVVRTRRAEGLARRVQRVYRGIGEVIVEHKPDALVIEQLYAHYKHPITAIQMGHVRGVICLLSAQHGIRMESLAPTKVKKSVSGRGQASKEQVLRMVQHTLRLRQAPQPQDVADALAVAITAVNTLRDRPSVRIR
jgi:crossover junction endodeoxyribonuclease RuvC